MTTKKISVVDYFIRIQEAIERNKITGYSEIKLWIKKANIDMFKVNFSIK